MSYWRNEANTEVAKAIQDVWNLQHALAEGDGAPTPQLLQRAKLLVRRAQIIEGHVERWKLWVDDEARKDAEG